MSLIVGDFNLSLPQQALLNAIQRPFNKSSVLLYEFMSENSLIVLNFSFTQTVNYTYEKVNSRAYIDHILITEQMNNCFIYSCKENVLIFSSNLSSPCYQVLPSP